MAAPPRILTLLPALDHSGAAFAAHNLLVGLVRAGVKPMVMAAAGGEREATFRGLGTPVAVAPRMGNRLLGRHALASARRFGPTLVHAQDASIARRAGRIAAELNVPLVVTVNRLTDGEERFLAGRSSIVVIAVSDAIRERLSNAGNVPRDRIRVVPNGLDLRRFPCILPEEAPPAGRLPVIGTFGMLTERKGQRVFLRAAHRVLETVDAEFLVLGQGPDKGVLRSLARELGIGKRITFGYSSQSSVQAMRNLDIYVEPSFEEGLGLSVLQAMASGIPVVASGVGGIYALVEDGVSGVLTPRGKDDALAEAITTLLKDPVRRQELALQARIRVEEEFSVEAVAERILQVYREACDPEQSDASS